MQIRVGAGLSACCGQGSRRGSEGLTCRAWPSLWMGGAARSSWDPCLAWALLTQSWHSRACSRGHCPRARATEEPLSLQAVWIVWVRGDGRVGLARKPFCPHLLRQLLLPFQLSWAPGSLCPQARCSEPGWTEGSQGARWAWAPPRPPEGNKEFTARPCQGALDTLGTAGPAGVTSVKSIRSAHHHEWAVSGSQCIHRGVLRPSSRTLRYPKRKPRPQEQLLTSLPCL